jgi:imidazolonepropionase
MTHPADALLHNARLCTLADADGYGLIDDGALAWRDGVLVYAGVADAMPTELQSLHRIDAHGAMVTPGLIDCHTHLVFAGERAGEFEQRLHGADYADIARAGGGIMSTVRATRQASEQQLLDASLPRAAALLADGVTTLEIKSGYALERDGEARMLRVARRIGTTLGIDVRTTFLGAHALPPEYSDNSDGYIDAICNEWLPAIAAEGLIDAVDAYCEGIGFSAAQTRRVFAAARAHGLPVKLHADQLSDLGGAALVAEFDGLSADHVEYSGAASVAAMAAAGTVAVLLPGAFYALRETRLPPIDAFRAQRVPMAVATDLNPGTSPLLSLRLAMNMACTLFRLTPVEALRGATVHAARALGLADRGQLRAGQRADLALWDVQHPAELAYWIGGPGPRAVYSAGRCVHGGSARD